MRSTRAFLLASLVLGIESSFILISSATAQTILSDNFESYVAGTFPSSGGWTLRFFGYGTSYQVIDNSQSVSRQNSLKLEGACNEAAEADHALSSVARLMRLEVRARLDLIESQCEPYQDAIIAFQSQEAANYYGVWFANGSVGGVLPFNYGQWYSVRVDLDTVARTYSAWLDGAPVFSNVSFAGSPVPNGIALTSHNARHTRTRYDNLVVQEVLPATVQTSPVGRPFTVDGTTYASTQTFTWTLGSSHTIGTTSPQAGTAGTRYVWSSWSDGGAMTHTINPTVGTTYTANFTTQYLLTMVATPSNGGTVTPASGWNDAGSTVPIQAIPNGGYASNSWSGSGTGSYTGTNNPASVTMNAPITETANFVLACSCPSQGDLAPSPNGDGVIDVFDVIETVGIAFSGLPDIQDPHCPKTRGDVNNDGATDVFDVIYLIAIAFSEGPNPVDPCGP